MAVTPRNPQVAEIEALFQRMTGGDIAARAQVLQRLPELLSLADDGDADAQALAGGLLLEHLKRPSQARRYFELAAEQGHRAGRRGLGFMLLGDGQERDVERAVTLLRAAADEGDAFAAFNLGVLFRKGELVARDEGRARAMFERAAELGLGAGAAVIAEYLSADGAHAEARKWNLRGAEGGSVVAMYALARSYRDGAGGPVDRVQAVRWFLRMLDWGDARGVQEAIQMASHMRSRDIRQAARLAGREADAQTLIQHANATGS